MAVLFREGVDQSAVASHAAVSCITYNVCMIFPCIYYGGLSFNIHDSNCFWFICTLCISYELYTSSTCLISQLTRNSQIDGR